MRAAVLLLSLAVFPFFFIPTWSPARHGLVRGVNVTAGSVAFAPLKDKNAHTHIPLHWRIGVGVGGCLATIPTHSIFLSVLMCHRWRVQRFADGSGKTRCRVQNELGKKKGKKAGAGRVPAVRNRKPVLRGSTFF